MQRIAIAFLITFALVVAAADVSSARIWHIRPDGTGDAPTIQAGIDSATAGDSVILSAGTYTGAGNRDIVFCGKAITVTSESGPHVTIIDCQRLGRGFWFQKGEGTSPVLSRVTIRNGFASDGYGGGGIYCDRYSSPTISGNTINGNSSQQDGGGIYCVESSDSILGNVISNNSAQDGGGILSTGCSSIISGNVISGNSAQDGGGIMYTVGGSSLILGNTISGNTAQQRGGGIYCGMSWPTISNNTLSGNSAASGGGIYCFYAGPPIQNTIIAFSSQGEGIFCGGSNPTLTSCDIYGNAGGDVLCGTDGGGNISADPLFCNPSAGDFYLHSGSPCVNNPGYGQIGAFGVGCGSTLTEETTWGHIKAMFR